MTGKGLARSPVRGNSGFTLLELLLAFMVFALSFATVMEILSGSMRNTVRARHYTEAALTAQSVMDQVGVEIPLEPGFSTAGESGNYRWQLEIYEFEGVESEINVLELAELTQVVLLQVDLHVNWGEAPKDHTRRFSTVKALLAGRLEQAETE